MVVIRVVLVVYVCLTCLVYATGADEARLKCLQFEQGKEVANTPWSRGYVSSDRAHQKEQAWIYNNTKCPLEQFSEEKFCNQAMKCGKHLLLVGDSTVLRIAITAGFIMTNSMAVSHCPTDNFCSRRPPDCTRGGHNERILMYTGCSNYCPTNQPVRITYIRHDYLTNIHGSTNYQSTICEHWKAVAKSVDYLLISTGPHIHGMLSHPYGRPAPPDFNEHEFFQREAHATTELVRSLMAPNATLIYRAGAVGLLNYFEDCNLHPHDSPPTIHSNFSWNQIPKLNEAYIHALTTGIPPNEHSVLIMDTATLFTKMQGCRTDHLHYKETTPATPVLLEWVILQNLLIEHHAARGG
jgi:hypothetical protein